MPNLKVHFMSKRLDWRTPKHLLKQLDEEFHFNHDPCPPNPAVDGLASEWGTVNFCNPPYGREIGKWVRKGYEEHLKGKTVVFLIPSRTDTAWWHEYVMEADEIRFVRGRLKFMHPDYASERSHSAPFPSCIVIFRARSQQAVNHPKALSMVSHEWLTHADITLLLRALGTHADEGFLDFEDEYFNLKRKLEEHDMSMVSRENENK